MLARLIGLLAGLALVGEGFLLWKPDAVEAMPPLELGPFSDYRVILAGLSALAGVMVVIASLLRSSERKRKAAPTDFAPPVAATAREPDPFSLDDRPPTPFPAPEPEPVVAHDPAPPPPAPVHDPEPLAPFPGAHAEEPEPEPEPSPPVVPAALEPAPEAAGQTSDYGRYLAALEYGDRLRAAGQLSDAIDPYSDALAIARRRLAAWPNDRAAQRDVALALTHVGDVHDHDGRLDSAIDLHEESLGLRLALAAEAPQDLAAQRELSVGLGRLADSREARGHRTRARDLFRQRLPLAEKLAGSAPGDSALAKDLADTRERLQELDSALSP